MLDKSGRYRLAFTTPDGEGYLDPAHHPLDAVVDTPPTIELTVPGRDCELPANGLLQVEGTAKDDHGVQGLTLHVRCI